MLALQLSLAVAPLVGWGLGDLRGFATNPARLGVVAAAVASCVLVARCSTARDPFAKGGRSPSRMRSAALAAGILSVPIVLGWFAYADRWSILVAGDAAIVRYPGLLLFATAEAVRAAALRALGRQYSAYVALQRDHVLIRDGIYGRVRHPIYLAQMLAVPAAALAFRSLLAAPILLLSALFVARRIAREEAMLARAFPYEFDEYRRGTWRLVPFVY